MTGPSSSSLTSPSSSSSWSIFCPQDGIWMSPRGVPWCPGPVVASVVSAVPMIGNVVAAPTGVAASSPLAWSLKIWSARHCDWSSLESKLMLENSPPRSKPALQGIVPLPRHTSGTVILYMVSSSARPIRTSTSEAKPKLRRDERALVVMACGFVSQEIPL